MCGYICYDEQHRYGCDISASHSILEHTSEDGCGVVVRVTVTITIIHTDAYALLYTTCQEFGCQFLR